MNSTGTTFARVRARLAFPILGAAMAVATIFVGLEHSRYLQEATGTAAAIQAEPVAAVEVSQPLDSLQGPAFYGSSDIAQTRVQSWIKRLSTSLRGDFTQSLARMDKYDDMINQKLDAKQMPRELIYLALIESNFNPTARSRVGAVGMWQFMSATARQLGLTVTKRTDERKNPTEATDAALSYLGSLYNRFGSWYLAAAAYNAGAGTVSKALMKVTGKTQGTDDDFFRIMSVLPKETQDYVPKLIASAVVASDPAKYGLAD